MKILSIKAHVIAAVIASLLIASCGRTSETHEHASDSTKIAAKADYYTCPMHPQVHSDKPGSCPICGMTLVKASSLEAEKPGGSAPTVALNERSQSLANVATTVVQMEKVEHRVRAFGTLEIPEPNKTMISARFSGRIEKLHVASVGASVRKGQPLFDIYSPDIVQAENDYMQAYKHAPAAAGAADQQSDHAEMPMPAPMETDQAAGTERSALLVAMRSKLQLLGFTTDQIRALESAVTAPLVFTYSSPASGIVVDKKVVQGMYVSEGLPLYEISDLSTLWNIADVYETDAALIRPDEKAEISLQNGTDRTFPAAVTFIYPVVDPQSRTVKIRLTVSNANGALKPNMYTQTLFTQTSGRALAVPVTAVLQTGKRNIVYVKSENGNQFTQREVQLGARFGGKFEILTGLREGETVVTEGGYLIDSESQLKSAAAH
jgi:membrane fusion protein, copper/silver efflux system